MRTRTGTPSRSSRTTAADDLEDLPLPMGDEERFSGWGIMALTFTSGHVLALRRWTTSSIGPAYTSVWHRAPDGRWRMWQDAEAGQACPRYFSSAVDTHHRTSVDLAWVDARTLTVRVPGVLDWTMQVGATATTRLMNVLAAATPQTAWRSTLLLRLMSRVAGPALGLGRFRLTGRVPNGQRFRMGPTHVAMVQDATATIEGVDLGPIGPLREQARLQDFWIPQRGLLAKGRVWMDPTPRDPVPYA